MLLIGTASLALCATSLSAQTAPAAASAAGTPEQSPEIVVTGTQIRGVAPVGSTVIGVGRSEIEAIGATTTNQILQLQPQVFNFGIADTQRNGTGGAGNITYGSAINLRGLSPFATLTLVDGHRVVPQGTVGAAVDPSSIPTVMLERVDIVPDGASATYGSDAIAGVVNLILRRRFEGLEVSGRYGFADSYHETQASVLAGHRWATGQITIGGEYSAHSRLSGLDRDFFQSDLRSRGGADNRSINCSPGTITVNGVNYAIPAGGVTPATAGQLQPNTVNKCDPIKNQDLIPGQRRYSVAATVDQSFGDRIRFFGDADFTRRDYWRRVPFTSGPLTVTNANPFFVAPPGTNATSEVINYWFGNQAIGNTWRDHGYSASYQLTGGFEFKLFSDWRLTALGTYGHDVDHAINVNIDANSPGVAAALASTNPTTALNLFGPNSASVLQGIANNLFEAPGKSRQYVGEAKLDGTLFHLPGGDVRAALGYQRVTDKLVNGAILGTVQNPVLALGPFKHLARTANAFYGELLLPIVGDGNAFGGVQGLQVDIGLRTTRYTTVGRTTDPKVGVNWTVVRGLKLHGSYGKSFRAPGLTELVGPLRAVFVQSYATPSGPVLGYTLGGGNINLKPEHATTWSLGGEWSPPSDPRLRISLNYFNIDYSNQVSSYLSNLNLLQNPGPYAGVITTCPSAACTAMIDKYINGTGPNADPLPVLGPILPAPGVFVNGFNQNLATTKTSGIDIDLRYSVLTASLGQFDLALTGTYNLQFKLTPTPGVAPVDALNHIGYPLRFRARGMIGWRQGAVSAVTFVNYQNGFTNDLATPVQKVSDRATVDLNLSYDLDRLGGALRGTSLSLNVRNLFDTPPPFVNIAPNGNGGGGYDPQTGDPIGRLVALSLRKRF
jgi:iron complex outermembrane receptor protein